MMDYWLDVCIGGTSKTWVHGIKRGMQRRGILALAAQPFTHGSWIGTEGFGVSTHSLQLCMFLPPAFS